MRTRQSTLLLSVLSGILVLPLCAQDPIRGPMLGWVWDARKESIRGILGIAGSSVLGPGVDLGAPVKFAAISGKRESAFVLLGDEKEAALVDLKPVTPEAVRLADVAAGAERVVLSPMGVSAVLVYKDPPKMVAIAGLAETPEVKAEIDLSNEGLPLALAVNDSCDMVLATFGEERRMQIFDMSGNRWMMTKEEPVRAVSFLEESRDALVAADDGVFLSREVSADGPLERIAEITEAGAVAALDRRRILVVDSSVQSVLEVNLEEGSTRDAQCPCAPKLLTRMTGSNVFRLNEVSNGPLWLVEVQESGLRTIFVPPDPSEPDLEE